MGIPISSDPLMRRGEKLKSRFDSLTNTEVICGTTDEITTPRTLSALAPFCCRNLLRVLRAKAVFRAFALGKRTCAPSLFPREIPTTVSVLPMSIAMSARMNGNCFREVGDERSIKVRVFCFAVNPLTFPLKSNILLTVQRAILS